MVDFVVVLGFVMVLGVEVFDYVFDVLYLVFVGDYYGVFGFYYYDVF